MTIIDILNRKTKVWEPVDLQDLHPYAPWEEDEEQESEEQTEIVLTNMQLLHRRLHEAVDPTWR